MLMLRPKRHDGWGVGILAVDRLPPPPHPQLRAFIWCWRNRKDAPLLNGPGPAKPVPAWLMVGQGRLSPQLGTTGGVGRG
ncbi:MAG: hypothetical protein AMS25_03270 [Gemmatimonas sp. SM23_52]|nr:MAG: hypothetical protein AMS25_03270 [Gemmatimonas sp. SM23_52]